MSHGKTEKYARMANQIGAYFAALPPEQAAAGVAQHIRHFWTPKMIAETLAALDAGDITLDATSGAGFAILRSELAAAN